MWKRLCKRSQIFLSLIFIFIALNCSYLTIFVSIEAVDQTPWLNGWNYRKSHVINPASGAGTNYQVQIITLYSNTPDSFIPLSSVKSTLPVPSGTFIRSGQTAVYWDGTYLHVWYGAQTSFGDDTTDDIYYTKSSDLINWDTPIKVIDRPSGEGIRDSVSIVTSDTIYLLCQCFDGSKYFIRLYKISKSADFTNSENYIHVGIALDVGGSGEFDEMMVASPAVTQIGSTNWLMYEAKDGDGKYSIGRVYFTDIESIPYTKDGQLRDASGNVIRSPAGETYEICPDSFVDQQTLVVNYWSVSGVQLRSITGDFPNNSVTLGSNDLIPRDDYDYHDTFSYIEIKDNTYFLLTSWYSEEDHYLRLYTLPSNVVNLHGHCRNDFGDVRFTDDDGITLLDYWIENVAFTPEEYSEYSNNPIQSYTNDSMDWPICVLKDGDYFYKYYAKPFGADRKIYRAMSSDGKTGWTDDPSTPVLKGKAGTKYYGGVTCPNVWKENGIYKMLFMGLNPSDGVWRTFYATSSDGITWTVQNNDEPVLEPSESWEYHCEPWGVIKVGETYYLWYNNIVDSTIRATGLATSTDCITWTRDPNNPIFTGGRFMTNVVKYGEYYYLFIFHVYTSGKSCIELYRDTSPTFYQTSREFIQVVKYPVAGSSWEANILDAITVLTDDVTKSSFNVTNGELWIYYGGNNGTTKGHGLLIEPSLEVLNGKGDRCATFWVEVADNLSTNPATIYIYYGKSDAPSMSNGVNTFIYFNHFDSSEDFTEEDGTWQLDATKSVYKYVSGGSNQVQSWKDIGRSANEGYRLRFMHKSSYQFDSGAFSRYENGYAYGGIYVGKGSAGTEDVGGYGENGWTYLYRRWSPTRTEWHISEALNFGQKYTALTDEIQLYSGPVNFHLTSTKIALAAWAGYVAEFDWIFVAKYVDPEPSHGSWGNEEPFEEVSDAPTVGGFQAPNTVYANRYFLLNATINDPDGVSDFANATIEISNDVVLEWIASTETFRKQSDPHGYCSLDSAGSFKTQLNSTAYILSWRIKLNWSYPEEFVSIISTNTKVFDKQGANGSANYPNLFYFEDDLIVYSASIDDSRTNPSQPITLTGTLYYQGTTTPPEDTSDITVRIHLGNIEKASTTTISPSGTFTISFASESTVGSYAYTIFAITDENSVQNQTIDIIVDRIKVSNYTISDNRANVGDNVNIDVTLVYEYDNTAVTTGTITINGYTATHIGSGVYRITRTLSIVGSETYNTVVGSESTYNLSTVNQNGQSTTVIWDMVIIDTFSVSDSRINIGSVASFTVAGKYAYDNTEWSGTYALNDTISKSVVGRYGYKISAITDSKYGLTVFQQTAPDLYVIFDRIKVSSGGVVDSRIDVNSVGNIWFELLYEYDLTPVSDGSVTFFGGKLATYGGNGKWWVNETQTSVAIVYYNVTEVDGNNHGITVINHEAYTRSIIWDEIKVISLTASHERIDVGSPATLTVQLIYEYDNSVVSSGSFTLNGLPLTYENGAWVARDTKNSVSAATYNRVDGTDGAYGLTLINMNGHSATVIWDMVIVTLSISDDRIDVGATATILKTGFYEYDSAPFLGTITLNDTTTKITVGRYGYTTSSISDPLYGLTAFTTNEVYCIFDRININTLTVLDNRINIGDTAIFIVEGVYEYDLTPWLGSYALNDTTTKITVGKYGYKIVSVTDSNYGLTAFRQTAPDIYVIFDRINVVTYGSDDTRRDVNTEAILYLTLEYEYDNSLVVDGIAHLNGSLPLTWSQANSRWEYKTIKSSIQKLTVYLVSVSENAHGITALNPNTSSKTISVIWDRIKITEGGTTKETLTLGETAIIWFKAIYEYDESTFTSANGSLYLNGTQMMWSTINMRWEYTHTANTIGTLIFAVSAVSDISQGLTTINDTAGAKAITVWSMPFSIISNSVITELTFDSTSKKITFTVSGQEGTIGYVNVTIAKTLIGNISDLEIYLDGKQINYTATSTEYTWLIHFTYTHSIHKVTILLTSLNNNLQPRFSFQTIVMLSGILIAIIAAILITRKKANKTAKLNKGHQLTYLLKTFELYHNL